VGLRDGLYTEARGKILLPLPGTEPRSHGSPVRGQTLYWLSYPGFFLKRVEKIKVKLFPTVSSQKLRNEIAHGRIKFKRLAIINN
jgi:hypothetical protein